MADCFPTSELGEVANLYDSLHQTPQYADVGYPMIRVTDIRRGFVETKAAVRVDEETYLQFSKKHKPQIGDILFSRVGSYGNSSYVSRTEEFCLGQNTVCISPDQSRIQPIFLYCSLNSDGLRHQIEALVGGASQGTISLKSIRQLRVPLPSLPVQRRIASILSAYDELMENSQQRIRILEAMARALYREWFVHFRFPGQEKLERVASPLGDIPQGWEVTPFGELYNTGSGGTPSRKQPEYFEGGSIHWVKSQELLDGFILSTEERITEQALENSSAKVFPANTVLIALYGATIGKLGILADDAATNQACCAVLPNCGAFGREFAFLTLLVNRQRIISLRLGAAQQNISQVLLRSLECVKPPGDIVSLFSRRAAAFFDEILTLQRQIQNLRRTRDLLLPRLLSGQIETKTEVA